MELILACDMTPSTTGVTRWRKSSWIDGKSAFRVADDTLCFIPPGQRRRIGCVENLAAASATNPTSTTPIPRSVIGLLLARLPLAHTEAHSHDGELHSLGPI